MHKVENVDKAMVLPPNCTQEMTMRSSLDEHVYCIRKYFRFKCYRNKIMLKYEYSLCESIDCE